MTSTILTERLGDVVTVTLNRPAKLNAFTVESWGALADAIMTLSADDTIRCVVMRGAGDKAFAAGADVSEFEEHRRDRATARTYGALVQRAIGAVAQCPHPIVAAIRGACIGGGLEIAAVCDLRIAAEGSRFGAPVTNLGLTMSHAELRGIVDLIGPHRTLELVLEAKIIDATEAASWGLVSRVVAADYFESEVAATASRFAAGAPLVARWHKQFIRRLLDPQMLAPHEEDEAFACFDTEDFAEGRRAFLEKRKPLFSGR